MERYVSSTALNEEILLPLIKDDLPTARYMNLIDQLGLTLLVSVESNDAPDEVLRSVRVLFVPRVIVGAKFDSDLAMHATNDVSELLGDSEWGMSGLLELGPSAVLTLS